MMPTLLEKPRAIAPATAAEPRDAEALIKEARQRARRRRILIGAAALFAALGSVLYALTASHTRGSTAASGAGGRGASLGSGGVVPKWPGALAVSKDGTLLIADQARNQILELLPASHHFRVFAGSGKRGFAGDGHAATKAAINGPSGMAVDANGSVYFADTGNNRIRMVSANGMITTVAGSGRGGWTKTGSSARRAAILSPEGVTVGPDRRLYIAATGSSEVLRLESDGTLTRIAGVPNRAGVYGIGGPATRASADGPSALAFDGRGNLFLAGSNTKTLLMISRDGRMLIPSTSPGNAAAQLARGFYPRGPGGLVSINGQVLGMSTQQILRITPKGVIGIYDFGHGRIGDVTGFLPGGIAVGPDGSTYTDTAANNGWSNASAIIAITPRGHVSTLWEK